MKPHLKVTEAGAVSALTFIVGQLAAFVPSIANQQQQLISTGSTALAVAFMVANAVHAHGKPEPAPAPAPPAPSPASPA